MLLRLLDQDFPDAFWLLCCIAPQNSEQWRIPHLERAHKTVHTGSLAKPISTQVGYELGWRGLRAQRAGRHDKYGFGRVLPGRNEATGR